MSQSQSHTWGTKNRITQTQRQQSSKVKDEPGKIKVIPNSATTIVMQKCPCKENLGWQSLSGQIRIPTRALGEPSDPKARMVPLHHVGPICDKVKVNCMVYSQSALLPPLITKHDMSTPRHCPREAIPRARLNSRLPLRSSSTQRI
ncbi:hypothetical protein E2C01_070413 [Portunus trituberculatus]|uniref:Uncharacterized protein n=1 Tax=Portunus trituberculatus TaxID=210409 RepID=A0A5B7HX86_PORTR|nr:hypothetical protein [Portunus trituberculatus]